MGFDKALWWAKVLAWAMWLGGVLLGFGLGWMLRGLAP